MRSSRGDIPRPLEVERPHPARRNPLLLWLLTLVMGATLAFAGMELLSYAFFRQRERADRDLRIFCRPDAGGMPIAVKRNFEQRWRGFDFDVRVRTDAAGLREDFELPTGQRVDVGFLGDSFTFGHGVEAGERYSDVIRRMLGTPLVVSYSYMNGWATPHYQLFLQENPALVPRVAVVGLFLGNDLSVDVRESTLVRDANGTLVAIHTLREPDELGHLATFDANPITRFLRATWSGRLLLHLNAQHVFDLQVLRPGRTQLPTAWIQRELDGGRLDADATVALDALRAVRDLVARRDGRLVVLLIPWAFYVSARHQSPYPPAESDAIRTNVPLLHTLADWCRREHIVCVDPLAALRDAETAGQQIFFRTDPHWTAAGHQVAAQTLAGPVTDALAEARP